MGGHFVPVQIGKDIGGRPSGHLALTLDDVAPGAIARGDAVFVHQVGQVRIIRVRINSFGFAFGQFHSVLHISPPVHCFLAQNRLQYQPTLS